MEVVALGSVISALAILGGLAVTLSKLKKSFKDEVSSETELAIEKAHKLAKGDLVQFQANLEKLEFKIDAMHTQFDSEIEHIKSTYNSEIRHLGEKLEELRSEVRHHHSQIIELLSKILSDPK